jgi:MFS family permease
MQFALGLHAPFLNSYLVDMGATYAELGAFRSVGNVAPTILQPVWGATSDRIGHNKAFVAFGTCTGLFVVYLFLWAATPLDMIILYAIQSVLLSVQIPTWSSLIGGLMGERNRGVELGRLGMVTNVASLVATLVSGFIAGFPALVPFLRDSLGPAGYTLLPPVASDRDIYYLPFYLTALVGIVASLLSLTIHERTRLNGKRSFPPVLKLLAKSGDFRRLCFTATFFSFGMSMAWPYFIIVQRVWLENSLLEIAIASAIMTFTTVIFTLPLGKLSDRVGRRPLIVMGRALLVLVPLLYALAIFYRDPVARVQGLILVYISNFIAGLATAASANATTAYIYDVAPEDERGAHISVFNVFTGIIFLLGSLIAGFLGEYIIPLSSSELAVFYMLGLSTALRFAGSITYFGLREPRQYTSDIRREITQFVHRRRHDADGV